MLPIYLYKKHHQVQRYIIAATLRAIKIPRLFTWLNIKLGNIFPDQKLLLFIMVTNWISTLHSTVGFMFRVGF